MKETGIHMRQRKVKEKWTIRWVKISKSDNIFWWHCGEMGTLIDF